MRLGFAILLIAMCFAGKADAAPPIDRPITAGFAAVSVAIADGFFDGLPCQPRLFWAAGDQLADSANVRSEDFTVFAATYMHGLPEPVACAIWLNDALLPLNYHALIRACSFVVHEVGHRLGFEHDDETAPGSVMNTGTGVLYDCYRAFLPKGKGRVWRRVNPHARWASRPFPALP